MKERLFQAQPALDKVHKELGLVEGYWYFWDRNYRVALGGFIHMGNAERLMRQFEECEKRQCPNCED